MNDRNTYRSQFAAYFAGKLPADDAAALEQALARDAKLAREAEALRPVVAALSHAAAEDAMEFRLSPDRLALIRAAASRQIVEFPRMAAASRRDVSLWRKLGPAVAAAMAVVIGAVSGFSSGRGSFESTVTSFQVANDVEPVDSAELRDADYVHYFPPAYGLDHYTDFRDEVPAWRATGTGIAMTELSYGLPGPKPAYLVPGNTFFLQ